MPLDRLVKVILYGSQARGDAREESDVDVLVVLRGNVCVHDEIKRTSPLVSDLLLKYHEYVTLQIDKALHIEGAGAIVQ